MKEFVKLFKSTNNGTGGIYGLKKIKSNLSTANASSMLEDYKSIVILKHSNSTAHVAKLQSTKMKLRKKNTNSYASDKQINNFCLKNKKVLFFYKKKKIYSNMLPVPNGSRVFVKYIG